MDNNVELLKQAFTAIQKKNDKEKPDNSINMKPAKVIGTDDDTHKVFAYFLDDAKQQQYTFYNKSGENISEGDTAKIFYTTNPAKGWVGARAGEPDIVSGDGKGVGRPSDWDNTSEYFNSYIGDNKNIAGTEGKKDYYSTARGYGTQATGKYSSAEGWETIASGGASHVEGYGTQATEWYAHAEGQGTTASGLCSHAEGKDTIASGNYSHVEGVNSSAIGSFSHAEGEGSKASGDWSHAENGSVASGTRSHSEGMSTSSAWCSHAEGQACEANNYTAHAEGYGSAANGYSSHSEGYNTTANGYASHAEGYESITNTNATYCHAEGWKTVADGNSSHSEGIESSAQNYASHAEGNKTTADGYACHSEGDNTQAIGQSSHAEGNSSIANGYACHAEGVNTQALSNCCHAEGFGTVADGAYCHAGGESSIAYGSCSFVHGKALALAKTDIDGRVAFGRYNDDTNTNLIFQIGNGKVVGEEEQRSNAFAVDNEGNIYCNGIYNSGGSNIVKPYDGSKETSTVVVSVDNTNNTIAASVNISTDTDNALSIGTDGGLYSKKTSTNIDTYLTAIKFTNTGFDLTFNGSSGEVVNTFTVTEDDTGNITKIINETAGRSIDITYD